MVAIRDFPGIVGGWKARVSPCQDPWGHGERTRSAGTRFACANGAGSLRERYPPVHTRAISSGYTPTWQKLETFRIKVSRVTCAA